MTRFLFSSRRHKKAKNIITSLCNRQYRNACQHRENLRILRCLVLDENVIFKKVFEKSSNRPIQYEGDRLFLDNHRTVMTVNSRHGKPGPLFKIPECRKTKKIEDVLVCEATLASIPLEHRGWRHCMVAVTSGNYLLRYDLDTGQELQRVFLHHKYQFRYLSMEDEAESIVVRSQHMTQESINVYKAVAVFTVFPLEFVCMFEVEKKIFGRDIQDCMLYQGLMINKHTNGVLRFYDFNKMKQKYITSEMSLCDIQTTSTGLPLNMKITETPDVLFEIKCYDHDLHVGGSPWQYVQAQGPSEFLVHLMDVKYQLTPGIRLGDGNVGLECDRAMFHPDDSGRIIHLTSQKVSVYKLALKSSGPVLNSCFTINASDTSSTTSHSNSSCSSTSPHYTTTSSGRRSRKVQRNDVLECGDAVTLDGLDYEDELELATACHVTSTSGETIQGRLCFYDNINGVLVKEMVLEEDWDEFGEHLVVLDRDSIYHIVSGVKNQLKHHIYAYKLKRKSDDNESENRTNNRKTKVKGDAKVKKEVLRRPGRRKK